MFPVVKSGIYSIKSVEHITQVADFNTEDQGSVFPFLVPFPELTPAPPAVGEREKNIPRQDVRVGAVNFGLGPISSPLYSGSFTILVGTFASGHKKAAK